jgi:hypothetical protein
MLEGRCYTFNATASLAVSLLSRVQSIPNSARSMMKDHVCYQPASLSDCPHDTLNIGRYQKLRELVQQHATCMPKLHASSNHPTDLKTPKESKVIYLCPATGLHCCYYMPVGRIGVPQVHAGVRTRGLH